MSTPTISKIRISPFKGLDPIELIETEIGIHCLKHDREWPLMTEDGRFINGKRTGLVNQLKTTFDFKKQHVSFSSRNNDDRQTFKLREDNEELVEYLSDYFGQKLKLVHESQGELMDIPVKSSATIVSQTTLESIRQDLSEHSIDDLCLRFRTNLEVTDAEEFWEETLFKEPETGMRFTIGEVVFFGIAPRERCNVPPRDLHR